MFSLPSPSSLLKLPNSTSCTDGLMWLWSVSISYLKNCDKCSPEGIKVAARNLVVIHVEPLRKQKVKQPQFFRDCNLRTLSFSMNLKINKGMILLIFWQSLAPNANLKLHFVVSGKHGSWSLCHQMSSNVDVTVQLRLTTYKNESYSLAAKDLHSEKWADQHK